ncbi:MAG: nucleotidyl transferase AbiEii/AbiGii toxin family protein [Methanocorpusculum sp.]|nr:nucleotidyl transferase AbiEii/AbiGii toxin family protein [Methanocorpusculum sp.]
MLAKENFTADYLRQLQKTTHRDPALLEKVIYAFGLLESLARVEMPFTFKGGTALILLLNKPLRISTDIDILVKPDTDIDEYIEKAAMIFPFVRYEESKRTAKTSIEKRHFRFYYISPLTDKEFNILLDVVFSENPYAEVQSAEIKNDLLKTKEPVVCVNVPTINCLLADKLTAFAPHTTGILFGIGKELEIIKQFYDTAVLIDRMDNFSEVKRTYDSVVNEELKYRGNNFSREDALKDTIMSAVCIAGRGKIRKDDYPNFLDGIGRIRNHVFESYSAESAIRQTGKTAYLAACILTDMSDFNRVKSSHKYLSVDFETEIFKKLMFVKKIDLQCYGYLVETEKLIEENGIVLSLSNSGI